MKAFPNKQKLKEFTTTRPSLQKMLKEALALETNTQKYTKLWVRWLRDRSRKLQICFRISQETVNYKIKVKGEKGH